MPQFSFGSGFLYGIPSGATPTPVLFGTLQDVTLDISYTVKKLTGQYQSPVAVARGPASYTGKAKAASISSQLFNTLFTGFVSQQGGLNVVPNEAFTLSAGTYTVANPSGFTDDLGVIYATTALPLTRVASAPTVGQYAVNTTSGVYTFNSSDNTQSMFVSYSYTTNTSATKSITYTNQLMGAAPIFSIVLNVPFQQFGTSVTYKFYQVMSTKLALDFKNEDFTVPEFDFECFANAAGQIYQATFNT